METLVINYGSILILFLRSLIVIGLFLFIKEYIRNKAESKEIKMVHHIVVAFVVSLGVMLTQSIVYRAYTFADTPMSDVQSFIISFVNTLITFVLMVYAYREYRDLLKEVNNK